VDTIGDIDMRLYRSNGTQVAFTSDASTLVANDKNGRSDVFVRDYSEGLTTKISRPTGAGQANGGSSNPSLSTDGRFVAFLSGASNLVPDDTNFDVDVFVRDRQNATTERISVSSTGEQANEFTDEAEISGNGRFVLFWSAASNLVPGDGEHSHDLFLRDRVAGTTELAIDRAIGASFSGFSGQSAAISADGRLIAFVTGANLQPDDTEFDADVYLQDRQLGTFERISAPIGGGSHFCCTRIGAIRISANGRFVAFSSTDPNLVPGDTNDHSDVFVRDRQLGTTVRASVPLPSDIEPFVQDFSSLSISDGGRHVCFTVFTFSPTAPRTSEVICRDIQAGVTKRASVSSGGAAANADATQSAMSSDGRFVVFTSGATNVVAEPIAAATTFRHERTTNLPTFTATPASLAFGNITANTTSAAKTVTVSNTGSAVVEISSVAVGGKNPAQFTMVNNCPTQLAAGAHCTVSVRFKPSSQGSKTAELRITTSVGGAKSIFLSGTGG
jgi:archaellum component FlaF (FlaF/FlaG flagellin family)